VDDPQARTEPPPARWAVVGPTHPAPGGIVHFTDGLARALEAQGPTLVIGWRRRFPAFLYPGTVTDERSTAVVSAAGEPVLDLLDPRTWRRAVARVRAFRADAVVLQWWHALHAPVVRSMARRLRRAGIPVVLICHNVQSHESNAVFRALTTRALRSVDAIVVHARALVAQANVVAPDVPVTAAFLPLFDNVADGAGSASPQEIRAVREAAGATDAPLALTFGYVRPYKGVEDAVEALVHTIGDVRLLVAGECWEEPGRFHELAARLGVADRVRFDLRYIPNDELPALFAAADVVVLPYREATQSAVAALAMAYRRPVVATDAGGLAELVTDGETGRVVPPRRPDLLAGAIDRVLADDRDWGAAIDRVRERLSWARYAEILRAAAVPRRDVHSHAVLDVASRRRKAAKLITVLEREWPLDGADILDIGTGNGTIAHELAAVAGREGSVASVDVADVRVDAAGYDFHTYDGERLPFADRSFDVAVSNHVLEHVGDHAAQRRHIDEIVRVLRPGGVAYVALPHRWQLVENHHRLPLLGWVRGSLADRYMRGTGRGPCFDIRALGRRELLRLMRHGGLEARDATADLVDVTLDLGQEASARLLRRLPGAARLLRGPLLPTIVAIGRRPADRDVASVSSSRS